MKLMLGFFKYVKNLFWFRQNPDTDTGTCKQKVSSGSGSELDYLCLVKSIFQFRQDPDTGTGTCKQNVSYGSESVPDYSVFMPAFLYQK